MLKKLHIVIVSFFVVLSISSNMYFGLILPVLIFYIFHDSKNMYYFYIPSIISIFIFRKDYLIVYLIILIISLLYIFIFGLMVNKNKKIVNNFKIINSGFIFITNIILFLFFNKYDTNVILIILYSFISMIIYLILDIYLYKLLSKKNSLMLNDTYSFLQSESNMYIEALIAFIAIIGSSYLNIGFVNASVILGSFYIMYFSKKLSNISIYIMAILLVIYEGVYLDIKESYIILIICGVYQIKSIYTILIMNIIFTLIILFTNTNIPFLYITLMIVSIVYEIVCYVVNKTIYKSEEDFNSIAIRKTTDEILKFAGFLDRFVIGFQNPKGFNEQISTGIKTIIDKHCKNCSYQKTCFNKNKNTLYYSFKDSLINQTNIDNCVKSSAIQNTSKLLSEKILYEKANNSDNNNYILLSQISAVSNAIKNYVVDMSTKDVLNYKALYQIKDYLKDLGLNVTYYEIVRNFEDDFLIKIGFKNETFDNLNDILKPIFEEILKQEISIELLEKENSNIYIYIMPKIIIDVNYAYLNMPASDEVISGDNFLIKEKNNGHMLFAISDGMGKGYSAFYESDMTLKLVDDIVDLNIASSTALEILNTFYTVQDYLERYATLDFLDINRKDSMATFYKMGATSTYIFKSDNTLIKINNKCLPLGIDEIVDEIKYKLDNDDLIIMSSDGIIENLIDEKGLEEFIKNSKNLLLEQLVYEILNYTKINAVKAKDDMTLLAIKIIKK